MLPAFLLIAILVPRAADRLVGLAITTEHRIYDVLLASLRVSCALLSAVYDADAWRRDLGLDGEV